VASCFGDDPSITVSTNNILVGSILDRLTYLYSVSADSYTPTGPKIYNDPSDEEGWATMADGRILNYDLVQSIENANGFAEIYTPSSGTWSTISPADGTANGNLPVLSSAPLGFELGPELRLEDGRVLVIGANQHTALYTESTNTWAPGPDMLADLTGLGGTIPNAFYGADDAPAAELPNGHVLLAADAGPNPVSENGSTTQGSPVITLPASAGIQYFWPVAQQDGKNTVIPANAYVCDFPGPNQVAICVGNNFANARSTTSVGLVFGGLFQNPTKLFDFNPAAGTMTPIAGPPPTDCLSTVQTGTLLPCTGSYVVRMLMLPTGQMLLTDSSNQAWVYTPDDSAPLSLRPIVNRVTPLGGGVYAITGKQLNGQSAGSAYGDDDQMDSNFPIVRLSDPSTGNVYYCKTTNWSSVSVGGDGTPETVDFTLNPNVTPGNYTLTVIGAGIASVPVAFSVASTAATAVSAIK
jgi:hypothetical protein